MRCLIDKIYLNNLPSEKQLARLILNIYEDFKQFKICLSQKDLIKCTGLKLKEVGDHQIKMYGAVSRPLF